MNGGTGGRTVDILIVGTWSGSILAMEALIVASDKMFARELQSRFLYIPEVIARSHESRMSPVRATPNLMK